MKVSEYLHKRGFSITQFKNALHALSMSPLSMGDSLNSEDIIALDSFIELGIRIRKFPITDSLPHGGLKGLYVDVSSGSKTWQMYYQDWHNVPELENVSDYDLLVWVLSKVMSEMTLSIAHKKPFIDHKARTQIRIVRNGKEIINTMSNEYLPHQNLFKIMRYEATASRKKIISRLSNTTDLDGLYYDSRLLRIYRYLSTDIGLQIEYQELSKMLARDFSITDTTKLTDYQIARLCAGMLEAEPRRLATNFFSNSYFKPEEKQGALQYIDKAINKYGKDLVLFCLSLPQKPFSSENIKRVFSEFDKTVKGAEISLCYDTGHKFKFFLRPDNITITMNGKDIARLDKSGVLEPLSKKTNEINMAATLVLAFATNPLGEFLFYGSATGECVFCHRELDHPISKLHGYGKACALQRNLPWG